MLGNIPPTSGKQTYHLKGLLPVYGQSLPHSHYDVLPIQPPHRHSHPYMAPPYEHIHSFQEQALYYSRYLPLNRITYLGPPGICHSEGLPPYQSHPAMLQSSYHVQYPNVYHAKLEDIARNSRELWFYVASVRELPGPIKAFIVVHHVCTRFQTRFSEEPPLTLFVEGLSNHKEMRPVRNINGLECKACCLQLGIATPSDHDKKSYSLPQLVKHFHQRHIEQPHAVGVPTLNWCTDMIHLPDLSIVSNLGTLTNIDNQKLALIYSALSEAVLSNTQSHYGQSLAASQLPDDEDVNRSDYCPSVNHSYQQVIIPQPKHVDIVREMDQHDSEMRNLRDSISKASSSSSIASCHPVVIHKSSMRSLTGTARNCNWDLPRVAEIDEDDGVDLIAGLESQLDQQASSACHDYPLKN
jgi:hypothetical protein